MNTGKTWWARRKWLLLTCGSILLVLSGGCVFFRISNLSDVLAYYGMIKTPTPMLKDFALRRFNQGDFMSDLLQRYPESKLDVLEDFQEIRGQSWANSGNRTYFMVLAKDNKLVDARVNGFVNGVPWDFAFFQSTNYDEFFGELERMEKQRIDQYKSQHHQ
jgi:hypothetical protein